MGRGYKKLLAMAAKGSSRVMAKCEASVAAGDYYAALQMYKTLAARCGAHQRAEAQELLRTGALVMLKHAQANEGSELANMLVEALRSDKGSPVACGRAPLLEVSAAFAPEHAEQHVAFLRNAIRWSTEAGAGPGGDVELQAAAARVLRRARDFAGAARHYLHASQTAEFIDMVVQWMAMGYRSERDLFLARPTLQLLSVGKLGEANDFFAGVVESARKVRGGGRGVSVVHGGEATGG